MTIIVMITLLLMFVIAQAIVTALDYDEAVDEKPDKIGHKMIRWLHLHICKDEEIQHD